MSRTNLTAVALFGTLMLVGCDRDPPEEEILEEHQETLEQIDEVTPEAVPVPVPVPVPVDTMDTLGADTIGADTIGGTGTDTLP